MTTSFANKCGILADLWVIEEEQIKWFYEQNEVSFSLAYCVAHGFAQSTPLGDELIDDLFAEMLDMVGVEDTGFESISDIDAALIPRLEDRDMSQDEILDVLRGEQ